MTADCACSDRSPQLAVHYSQLSSHYSLLTALIAPLTPLVSALTAHYSLLAAHYPLFTAWYSLLTTHYLPCACPSFATAYHSLLTVCIPLLTMYYSCRLRLDTTLRGPPFRLDGRRTAHLFRPASSRQTLLHDSLAVASNDFSAEWTDRLLMVGAPVMRYCREYFLTKTKVRCA